ncbi:MAG: zinc carboxypeptidase [Candidatus Riflebacteria bacterium]|nr:zinc carboxypeptidase [Candidatus Riflebacteria bacterium]
MNRVIFLLLCFCAFAGIATAEQPKSLVRVSGLSKADFRALVAGDYDIAKTGKEFAELAVSLTELENLKKIGRVEILIPDLDAYIADIQKSRTDLSAYFTYETLTAALQEWAVKYSKIARLASLGKTSEGRDIWAMKVSNAPDVDQKKPACLIMGAHHAREWISVEIPMESLKQYLEGYGQDERITKLVDDHEVWFVPMVNPDGVTYSQTHTKFWRKNCRQINASNWGVDPNRNYGYYWGTSGTLDEPMSEIYPGPASFSEAETQAIKALADREHFQASLSFHSYSELILYPYSYDYDVPCEDTPVFAKWSKEMAAVNGYTPENCTDLYAASGVSDDWLYATHKTLAFTIELGKTFIPPMTDIPEIKRLNVPVVLNFIEKSGEYAINSPSGSEEIIANLDLTSALNALSESDKMLPLFSSEAKCHVMDHMNIAGKRIADIIAAEAIAGKSASLAKVCANPSFPWLKSMIRSRIIFETVHGKKIDPSILHEFSIPQ